MAHPLPTLAFCAAAAAALLATPTAPATPPVWALPEGFKVDRTGDRVFSQDRRIDLRALRRRNSIWNAEERTVSLRGARGETLAFQIMIEGGTVGRDAVNVVASPLGGPGESSIDTSRIELFKAYYTRVDSGSGPTNGPSMGPGWYPDALVPWDVGDTPAYGGYDGPPFRVLPGSTQSVWVDLAIPYGLAPGRYAGTLTVSSAAGTASIVLSVRVLDFDIPRAIHQPFFMNFSIGDLNQAGGDWLTGAARDRYEDEVYRTARRHRFTAGNMYRRDVPRVVIGQDGRLAHVDWSDYDRRFDRLLSRDANLFGPGERPIELWKVPAFPGIKGGSRWPSSEAAWDQMLGEIVRHWRERRWDLDRAYVYLADEPPAGSLRAVAAYARRVRQVSGGALRSQVAMYRALGSRWFQQTPVLGLLRDVDMLMVAGDYYNPAAMAQLPRETWRGMYQGGEPYQGNETLDADGVALRSWSWIAWLYRIDYLCYYSMAEAWRRAVPDPARPGAFVTPPGRAGENRDNEIWDQPRNRPWAVSQGVFIYPGRRVSHDQPIVNIRMKQVRRGQTDFEYFWLLKQAGEGAFADTLARRILTRAVADAAPAPERYGPGHWSHDPEDWEAALAEAATRLERVKGRLPREPASLTAPAREARAGVPPC